MAVACFLCIRIAKRGRCVEDVKSVVFGISLFGPAAVLRDFVHLSGRLHTVGTSTAHDDTMILLLGGPKRSVDCQENMPRPRNDVHNGFPTNILGWVKMFHHCIPLCV